MVACAVLVMIAFHATWITELVISVLLAAIVGVIMMFRERTESNRKLQRAR